MTNTKNTIARKLTLEEIKALSRGSVVWVVMIFTSEDGTVFHTIDPVMVWRTKEGSGLIGCSDECSYIDICIDDDLFSDPDLTIWNIEPDDNQLKGISQEEFDSLM